jgi:hypothetical protein
MPYRKAEIASQGKINPHGVFEKLQETLVRDILEILLGEGT